MPSGKIAVNGRLYVKKTPDKGRGVFTSEAIKIGEVIEVCPIIELNQDDLKILDGTTLYNYYFLWGVKENKAAIALGFGSLYNHKAFANAHYLMNFQNRTITVFAIKNIEPKEEIFFNYNGVPECEDKVWFEK
jgi:SET domain-containing protein